MGTTVSDHGGLTGLADDDHTQYHTDARADAWIGAAGGAVTEVLTADGVGGFSWEPQASASDDLAAVCDRGYITNTPIDAQYFHIDAMRVIHRPGDGTIFFGDAVDATHGWYSVSCGIGALGAATGGDGTTAIGYQALRVSNTFSGYKTGVGERAMEANEDGQRNVWIGADALGANVSGDSNISIGSSSMNASTSGNQCVGIGRNSLHGNTTGYGNVGVTLSGRLLEHSEKLLMHT